MSPNPTVCEKSMQLALELAKRAVPEDTRPRPKVAAVLALGDEILGSAFRGEATPGDHAEYTLLQHKLAATDLRGSTLFTTLEPCTRRNEPKRACADRIVERGITRVVVGMLDPNPIVYEQGVKRLRQAGVTVDFFPAALRTALEKDNEIFLEQFKSNSSLAAQVIFNFRHNDGLFKIGTGDLTFRTRWSNGSNEAVYSYVNGPSLPGIGVVTSATTFEELGDATAYDTSSTSCFVREGEFVVFRNGNGAFAAARVDDVRARSHGDQHDALTISYRINPDGNPRFASALSPCGDHGPAA